MNCKPPVSSLRGDSPGKNTGMDCHALPQAKKFQFSSVTQSCLTLCDPVDCSTPGFPVHHQLLEPTQTHVYHVGRPSNHLILCRPLLLRLNYLRIQRKEKLYLCEQAKKSSRYMGQDRWEGSEAVNLLQGRGSLDEDQTKGGDSRPCSGDRVLLPLWFRWNMVRIQLQIRLGPNCTRSPKSRKIGTLV